MWDKLRVYVEAQYERLSARCVEMPQHRNGTESVPYRFPGVPPGYEYLPDCLGQRALTVSIAQKVLRRFKAGFPEWHQVAWRNSVVEITSIGVQVWHVQGGKLVRDEDAPKLVQHIASQCAYR